MLWHNGLPPWGDTQKVQPVLGFSKNDQEMTLWANARALKGRKSWYSESRWCDDAHRGTGVNTRELMPVCWGMCTISFWKTFQEKPEPAARWGHCAGETHTLGGSLSDTRPELGVPPQAGRGPDPGCCWTASAGIQLSGPAPCSSSCLLSPSEKRWWTGWKRLLVILADEPLLGSYQTGWLRGLFGEKLQDHTNKYSKVLCYSGQGAWRATALIQQSTCLTCTDLEHAQTSDDLAGAIHIFEAELVLSVALNRASTTLFVTKEKEHSSPEQRNCPISLWNMLHLGSITGVPPISLSLRNLQPASSLYGLYTQRPTLGGEVMDRGLGFCRRVTAPCK